MKKLKKDIETQTFAPCYLLLGSEDYLIRYYKRNLMRAIAGDDALNVNVYEGKEGFPGAQQLIELAETLPFFAPHRLIVLDRTDVFRSQQDALADYIRTFQNDTILIFIENEVDRRGRLYKAVKEKGYIAEFPQQTEAALSEWILRRLKAEKKQITRQTMRLFLERVGVSMDLAEAELEKLIFYTADREVITDEDIETICTPALEIRVFDLVDAMAEKNQRRALSLYEDLLASREPPMRMLFLLVRQFRIMLQTALMTERGMGIDEIARIQGVASFVVRRARKQMAHFTIQQLREALAECLQAEEAVKQGRLDDRLGVELILIQYSTKE